MKPTLEISGNTASLSGQLTVKYHQDVLKLMQEVAAAANVSIVAVKQPEEIDLTCIQILWSLSSDRMRAGNPLSILLNVNESDAKIFHSAGFSDLLTRHN